MENEIRSILKMKNIAVVGLSKDPAKASHDVATYMRSHGYNIIPVNPTADEVMGLKCYKSLPEIPPEIQGSIDVVDIFRPSQDIPPIVDQAVQLHSKLGMPKVIWMQLGIVNEGAANKARESGMMVVMDRCMKIEHGRLMRT